MSVNLAVLGGGIYLGTDRTAVASRIEVNGDFGQFRRTVLTPSGTQFGSLHLALAYQPTFSEGTLSHRFFAAAGYSTTWRYGEISNSNPSLTARIGITVDLPNIAETALSIEGLGLLHIGEYFFVTGNAGLQLDLHSAQLGVLLFTGAGVSF